MREDPVTDYSFSLSFSLSLSLSLSLSHQLQLPPGLVEVKLFCKLPAGQSNHDGYSYMMTKLIIIILYTCKIDSSFVDNQTAKMTSNLPTVCTCLSTVHTTQWFYINTG